MLARGQVEAQISLDERDIIVLVYLLAVYLDRPALVIGDRCVENAILRRLDGAGDAGVAERSHIQLAPAEYLVALLESVVIDIVGIKVDVAVFAVLYRNEHGHGLVGIQNAEVVDIRLVGILRNAGRALAYRNAVESGGIDIQVAVLGFRHGEHKGQLALAAAGLGEIDIARVKTRGYFIHIIILHVVYRHHREYIRHARCIFKPVALDGKRVIVIGIPLLDVAVHRHAHRQPVFILVCGEFARGHKLVEVIVLNGDVGVVIDHILERVHHIINGSLQIIGVAIDIVAVETEVALHVRELLVCH